MSTTDLGPIIFVGAMIVVAIVLVIAVTGNAAPSVLAACAQALQALSRGLLWALGQHNEPDQGNDDNPRDPRSS